MDNDKLVKALADAGHRESALLLKNWGEMDANAETMAKSMEKYDNAVRTATSGALQSRSRVDEQAAAAKKPTGAQVIGRAISDAASAVGEFFSGSKSNSKRMTDNIKKY